MAESLQYKNPNEPSVQLSLTKNETLLGDENYADKPNKCPCVYYRILGYSVGGAVHLGNVLAMALALRGPVMEDPDIAHFYSMEFIYITIWNLAFQLLYIGMGLVCDLPSLLKMRNYKFIKWLRWYRKTYYSGIIWPCGIIIFLMFWPLYIYDRNLIFPDYIDKVLSQVSNYIIHMFILFPIVWDLFFLPNKKPSSQKYTLAHCVGLGVVYLIVLFSHYAQREKWPYPILKHIYGTVYFPLVFIMISIVLALLYVVQWPLMSCIWRFRTNKATCELSSTGIFPLCKTD